MLKTEWKMANVQVCQATFDPETKQFSDIQSLYISPLADAATVDSLKMLSPITHAICDKCNIHIHSRVSGRMDPVKSRHTSALSLLLH